MTLQNTATLWNNIERRAAHDFLVTPEARLSFAALGHAIGRWLAWFDTAHVNPATAS